MSKQRSGFTLVELLAVIVILAVILVIAVPSIMSTITESRKGALESSAKLIASSAETAYISNQTLGIEKTITCSDVSNYTAEDYESCSIKFVDGKAKVTLVGKGKFAGMAVCGGTKEDAEATEGACNGTGGSETGGGSESGGSNTPTLISFTIDGTSYQVEEGMTWAEWATDNTDGYTVTEERIGKTLDSRTYLVYDIDAAGVVSSNEIEAKSYKTVKMPVSRESILLDGEMYGMLNDIWKCNGRDANLYKINTAYCIDLSTKNFEIIVND